jgi:hypothetical protein
VSESKVATPSKDNSLSGGVLIYRYVPMTQVRTMGKLLAPAKLLKRVIRNKLSATIHSDKLKV